MKLKSYAKLNLYLEVLNIRKDNYHNIITLFERIDLYDEILIQLRRDSKINLICNHRDVPKASQNLAFRAAALLQKESGVKNGVDIKIIKHIPVAAGLGGGSSNAATILLGLNRLWKVNFSRERLINLARKMGSDIPFFLYEVSFAVGKERGDKITPLYTLKKKFWHILVVPAFLVSTPSIYGALDKQRRLAPLQQISPAPKSNRQFVTRLTKPLNNVKMLPLALKKGNAPLIGTFLFNRLEEVTLKLYPQIKKLEDKLSNLGLEEISMSGSGPAMFGVVSSRKEGEFLCRQLEKSGEWQTFVVRTV